MKPTSTEVIIVNELGLHARSAAMITAIARNAVSNIWITKDGHRVDASSVLDILTLACEKNTKITISVENSSDIPILKDIQLLIESGFGEDVRSNQ